jgi:syntaxin-binding protein 1
MEYGVDDCLDQQRFPFLGGRPSASNNYVPASSARYGNWHKGKKEVQAVKKPRLIIFVVGGLAYSEIRSAYEVSAARNNWEVVVGSTHILTPEMFLDNLESLSE